MADLRETQIPGQVGDPKPQIDQAHEAFRIAVQQYEELTREVEIVGASLLGIKDGFRTGYIFNVLTGDFTPEQLQQDPRFIKLKEGANATAEKSRAHMPLRIAIVLPSQASELRRKYQENGVELEEFNVQPGFEFTGDAIGLGTEDILIGGSEHASAKIDLSKALAEENVERFGTDRKQVEETFSLDMSGVVRDQDAARLVCDIALARNLSDWRGISGPGGGFAAALELRGESFSVISEVVINAHDTEVVSKITQLDIKDAIESGALRLDLTK